jgi:hypothetical protein
MPKFQNYQNYKCLSIIILFISIILHSCSIQRKTVVKIPEVKKVIIEKYSIRNDSVFIRRNFGRLTCISVIDTVSNRFIVEEYSKGKLSGKQYAYESDGSLVYYGEYRKGKKHGWHFGFMNGRMWSASKYKNGIETYSGVYDPPTNW